MGFAPSEVDAMTFWEFSCCAEGFSRANGGKQDTAYPTDEEFEAALMRLH